MIRHVHVQNFRCLRDVSLDLSPLTVLVGPNASGKSSLLEVLEAGRDFGPADQWQLRAVTPVLRIDDWTTEVLNPQRARLYRSRALHLDVEKLRESNVLSDEKALDRRGSNLANVVASLPRRQQEELSREFCRQVPVFSDVDVRPSIAGQHRVMFQDRWNPETWYGPGRVSDGSMLVLAYLSVAWSEPVDLLLIEEPERGLHPYLLGQLIALFRRLATGELGKPTQIILATHSAELLEFVKPEEVRFFSRQPETGDVQVEQAPTGETDWPKVLREYQGSMGSLWLSGSLGGVPSGRG